MHVPWINNCFFRDLIQFILTFSIGIQSTCIEIDIYLDIIIISHISYASRPNLWQFFFCLFYFTADKEYFPKFFSSFTMKIRKIWIINKVAVRIHHLPHRIFTCFWLLPLCCSEVLCNFTYLLCMILQTFLKNNHLPNYHAIYAYTPKWLYINIKLLISFITLEYVLL